MANPFFAVPWWSLLSVEDLMVRFLPGALKFVQSTGISMDRSNYCTIRASLVCSYAQMTHFDQAQGSRADTYLAVGWMDYQPEDPQARGLPKHCINLVPVWLDGRVQIKYLDIALGGLTLPTETERLDCDRYEFR